MNKDNSESEEKLNKNLKEKLTLILNKETYLRFGIVGQSNKYFNKLKKDLFCIF